jgi:hypothetical protein
VRTRHNSKIDWVAIGVCAKGAIALVVAEAVLYPNDDPAKVNYTITTRDEHTTTYHRFVNTTPKPSATKNNSGELELLLLPGLPVLELVDDGEEVAVEVVMMSATTDYCGSCGDG